MTREALRFLLLPLLGGMLFSVACDARAVRTRDGGGDGAVTTGCSPGTPGLRCDGSSAIECLADGTEASRTDCLSTGQVCAEGLGCRMCRPSSFTCTSNNVERCNADGSALEPFATCDSAAGQVCDSLIGACVSLCQQAATSSSYIGCEYWPTPAMNGVYEGFEFAVVVANPQAIEADVTVTRGGAAAGSARVPAGGVATIRLPWIDALKSPGVPEGELMIPAPRSALVRNGAYRLQSNVPVTVYQFNPLEYRTSGDCPEGTDPDPADGACYSYTNDASLLLPTHVLTGNYLGVARPTRHQHTIIDAGAFGALDYYTATSGYLAVVGAGTGPVTVNVTLASNTARSEDGTISAGRSGDTQSYTLNPGDVLQLASAAPSDGSCTVDGTDSQDTSCETDLGPVPCTITYEYCRVGDDYDLTGTRIQATGPVMVLGGHECAFVPHNRWACDHLEETVFPLEAWGDDFIVSITQPLRGEPNLIRIVSGADANQITFEPASAHAPITLSRGQMAEFEASQDFRVTGSAGALLVTQFLVGQDYAGLGAGGAMGQGDPAMSFAIPTEQFRTEYTFLAPETFERNFVNVVGPVGVDVYIQSGTGAAQPVTGWRAVAGTGMQTARVEISGGTHTMTSGQPFGIVVYGFGSYTSYMYPGGLDFRDINPLI